MILSPAEKEAGRQFRADCRDALRQLNADSPPDAVCSPYSPPYFRHPCKTGRGTVAMHLKTRADPSPDSLFSWVWLEGSCKACGFTVRSGSGYIIVNEEDSRG